MNDGIKTNFDLIPNEAKYKDRRLLEERFRGSMQDVVARYCTTPDKYRKCTFEMEDPSPQQQKAIRIFKLLLAGDEKLCEMAYFPDKCSAYSGYSSEQGYGYKLVPCPLRPNIGIYLHGDVGRGKTHIMAAYTNELLKLLHGAEETEARTAAKQIEELVESAAKQMISLSMAQNIAAQNPEYTDIITRAEAFYKAGLERISASIRRDFSRKDLFFMSFDSLVELYTQDSSILREAVEAPIMVVDDVHLKGEEQRARIVQDLLERRYNAGRRAIFMNSNLSPEALIKYGNFDKVLVDRILSRCKEMFYEIEINDTPDYRNKIGGSVGANIESLLTDPNTSNITEAKLAERNRNYEEASTLYERGGDLIRAAETANTAKLYDRASQLFERCNKLEEAGDMAEKAGQLERAIALYERCQPPVTSWKIEGIRQRLLKSIQVS